MIAAGKILIVGPAWVGDMVMAQTLFTLLKRQNPDVLIDVLAPAWGLPLLKRFPEVRQPLLLPLGHGQLALKQRYQIARNLRAENYSQAIVLPNSFKSALIPFWAGIPQRTGWRGEMRWGLLNDLRYLDKTRLPLMIQRFIALGLPPSMALPDSESLWPKLVVDEDALTSSLAQQRLQRPQRPLLALCPGAEFGMAKRWPTAYFAELAQQKIAEGWDVWLFGSAKEQPIAQEIQEKTQHRCVDLTGKTTLVEAMDFLSLADVVVTNDSGLMHIAAAINKPLVVIYGSSDPRFTPPLTKRVQILSLNLPCSPCFQRECPLKHLRCLKDLHPDHVNHAIHLLRAS